MDVYLRQRSKSLLQMQGSCSTSRHVLSMINLFVALLLILCIRFESTSLNASQSFYHGTISGLREDIGPIIEHFEKICSSYFEVLERLDDLTRDYYRLDRRITDMQLDHASNRRELSRLNRELEELARKKQRIDRIKRLHLKKMKEILGSQGPLVFTYYDSLLTVTAEKLRDAIRRDAWREATSLRNSLKILERYKTTIVRVFMEEKAT